MPGLGALNARARSPRGARSALLTRPWLGMPLLLLVLDAVLSDSHGSSSSSLPPPMSCYKSLIALLLTVTTAITTTTATTKITTATTSAGSLSRCLCASESKNAKLHFYRHIDKRSARDLPLWGVGGMEKQRHSPTKIYTRARTHMKAERAGAAIRKFLQAGLQLAEEEGRCAPPTPRDTFIYATSAQKAFLGMSVRKKTRVPAMPARVDKQKQQPHTNYFVADKDHMRLVCSRRLIIYGISACSGSRARNTIWRLLRLLLLLSLLAVGILNNTCIVRLATTFAVIKARGKKMHQPAAFLCYITVYTSVYRGAASYIHRGRVCELALAKKTGSTSMAEMRSREFAIVDTYTLLYLRNTRRDSASVSRVVMYFVLCARVCSHLLAQRKLESSRTIYTYACAHIWGSCTSSFESRRLRTSRIVYIVSHSSIIRCIPQVRVKWMGRAGMRLSEAESASDCILVVGVSRPKLAAAFLTVALISLFLTFHILYDSALYSLHAAAAAAAREAVDSSSSSSSLDLVVLDNGIDDNSYESNSIDAAPFGTPPAAVTPSLQLQMAAAYNTASPPAKAHFPKTSRQLPQAIIVGVRKCGTRALLEMLFLHPQIQKAAGEVHFFDRDDNYSKGLEWYRKKMPYSFKGQVTIEKSPSYFVTPEVPERIFAMNASVRLLVIVREPVTRAISDYAQLRSHASSTPSPPTSSFSSSSSSSSSPSMSPVSSNNVNSLQSPNSSTSTSLQQQQQQQPQQQQQRSFDELAIRSDGTINESYRPIAISIYHMHMYRWLEVFERRQILIVNGDQLIDDPVPQLKRIESFLRLESHIGRHNFYFNHTKGFYCMRSDSEEKCLKESKGRRHPRVSPMVVSKLRRFFSEHNRKFYDLVGEDLGWPEE
ncbi:unnamed protein product [Trichogramma brassicae]|uniref:Sulfotransferase domain-containing protein n=1 Tax=Trichogramma brassicae TaxID=86971 RepID=A0A6H5IHY3_9HYME|nr:unnamed protein product [Trichogramma brassicae]